MSTKRVIKIKVEPTAYTELCQKLKAENRSICDWVESVIIEYAGIEKQ